MKDYFIIIANSDLKNYSELKNYIESIGKTIFIPSVDIDSNDIYGIKVFEGLKESNEVIVVQTPSLGDDEKAMDQVFLAHSIKPDKIMVWEPDSFKLSSELKTYLRKSPKFNNLNELLGIDLLNVPINEVDSTSEDSDFSTSQEDGLNVGFTADSLNSHSPNKSFEKNTEELISNTAGSCEQQESNSVEIDTNNSIGEENLQVQLPSNNNQTELEKFSDIKFSFDDGGNLWIKLIWRGQLNENYLIKVFVKKVGKNNFKERGRIMKEGSMESITNNCKIESFHLSLTHDKVTGIDIQIELQKLKEGYGYVVEDTYSTTLNVYHYFNFFSKSVYEIRG